MKIDSRTTFQLQQKHVFPSWGHKRWNPEICNCGASWVQIVL